MLTDQNAQDPARNGLAAKPVGTIEWIRDSREIAVPVYQREYRWSLDSCRELLDDIKAVGCSPDGEAIHFLGAILTVGKHGTTDVTLVDGHQRLTTLMLLLLAVRDAAHTENPVPTDASEAVAAINALVFSEPTGTTCRLKMHPAHDGVLKRLADGGSDAVDETEGGALKANYDEFSRAVAGSWRQVWQGLGRLRNVVITLGRGANAQQVFESLNSTGEPLVNHELMHNYVLMGLDYGQQLDVEQNIWATIEASTGDATERFWRDYLVLNSERTPDLTGEHGLFKVFKERFPNLGYDEVEASGASWVEHAGYYKVLRSPELADDDSVAIQLQYLRDHFPGMSPLTLGLYRELAHNRMSPTQFVATSRLVQSMSLRRAFVGLDRDLGLAATLCRVLSNDATALDSEIVRRTPEDRPVRLALQYQTPPLVSYILQRLQSVESLEGMQVEHIHPQTPNEDWTGDGVYRWGDMDDGDRAELKVALKTIGNLTLLEAPLNQGASNRPFAGKKSYYSQSKRVAWARRDLAVRDKWGKDEIESRTKKLTEEVLQIWHRPAGVSESEPVELTRVVDLPRHARRDLFKDQFDFVFYGQRQLGDVTGVKDLWLFIVKELWQSRRDELLAYATANTDWPFVRAYRPPNQRWEPLDGGYFLFWGWAWQWLLTALQALIQEFSLEDEVRVKLRDVETDVM